ncbi:ragulator complex protein LAMTOR1-like [Pollicipes pollicipes]|uniref:ragulator complex protein LAMTOR1-like n=1 Tax=Pollicipes pollicipes TaxID=41117 RepID=UPI0018859247|nr:ragulator complex protein LAMTOR1-like [Pollicipes pollicipes]XP_037086416.1 ragulator complex protein LAMTOR1-like [Pollicipes pollicipes]XP_037086417.1 ragulator complex protein LAMTOR1-like [Pollicipes pollicipes]
MGCCCSTEDGAGSETGEPNARTPLLGEPPGASSGSQSGELPAEAAAGARPGEARSRGDGETLLDNILQDMAASVIDVAAVDTQNLEQQDYVERLVHYNGAVARLAGPPPPPPAIEDVPQPERVLAAPPVRPADLRLARALADRLQEAARAVQVAPRESLVIPFGQTASAEPA